MAMIWGQTGGNKELMCHNKMDIECDGIDFQSMEMCETCPSCCTVCSMGFSVGLLSWLLTLVTSATTDHGSMA